MKKISCFTVCVIFALSIFAQHKKESVDALTAHEKKSFPFDEFTISTNKTIVADENTKDRFGFGAGIYHVFLKQKKLNLISGVEFTNTNQFKYSGTNINKYAYSRDVTYHMNTVSIPFSVRFNMGKKTRFFFETGVYLDVNITGRMTGTIFSARQVVDSTGQYHLVGYEGRLDEHSSLKGFNGGASGGIGVSIPLSSKLDLLIKSDYRYGIRDLSDYNEDFFIRYIRAVVGIKWNQ
jgi:hypothetical protein